MSPAFEMPVRFWRSLALLNRRAASKIESWTWPKFQAKHAIKILIIRKKFKEPSW